MRAVLLASATATTSGGRRRRNPITHGSALVAFDRSKLALALLIRSRRKYWLPRLDIPPRRCLPPVEFCRGTRPSQAANSRPLRKPFGSTTVAAMAVAMIGPMPGTLARRWLTGLLLCQAMSCFSISRPPPPAAQSVRPAPVALGAPNPAPARRSDRGQWRSACRHCASPAARSRRTRPDAHAKRSPAPYAGAPAAPGHGAAAQQLAGQPLDRHKAHRRPHNRLADCFRIGGIVLVALDVRLHVLRRHH